MIKTWMKGLYETWSTFAQSMIYFIFDLQWAYAWWLNKSSEKKNDMNFNLMEIDTHCSMTGRK